MLANVLLRPPWVGHKSSGPQLPNRTAIKILICIQIQITLIYYHSASLSLSLSLAAYWQPDAWSTDELSVAWSEVFALSTALAFNVREFLEFISDRNLDSV